MRKYYIDEIEVNALKNSFCYIDKINERSTCSFVAIDPDIEIDPDMDVLITDDDVTIFAGTVDLPKESGVHETLVNCSCVDYSQLADTRIVVADYENEYAGDIVKDIISTVFASEGITEGTIQDGPIINKAVFNYVYGNVALNYISELTGYNWCIDNDKALHFFERSTFTAPISITDTSRNYISLSVSKSRKNYRNKQYTRGGNAVSELIELEKPTPAPDGVSRTFVTRLPLAKKPRIFIDSVEVAESDIGIRSLDSGKKFYFAYNSNTISQDTSQAVLSSEVIEVTYRGLYPPMAVAENPGEIADKGIYENVTQATELTTLESTVEYTQALLLKYGIIPRIIEFDTYATGLKAGQLISIQHTKRRLNDTFLIESVSARADGALTRYSVKALDGSALGGWEQLFKSLLKGNQKLVIRENEVIILLSSTQETWNWTEELTAIMYTSDYPQEDYPQEDFPSIASEEAIIA